VPSFEWQRAQWSAQWARASASTSREFGTGLLFSFAPAGMAALRAVAARYASKADGLSRALNPLARVFRKTSPPAAASTTPATAPPANQPSLRILFFPQTPLLKHDGAGIVSARSRLTGSGLRTCNSIHRAGQSIHQSEPSNR